MSILVNLASNLTPPSRSTGWIARIVMPVAASFILLFFVGCESPDERSTDPHRVAKSPFDSSCEQQICKLGEWSVSYFPMGQRPIDNDRDSTEALSKFQQSQPVAIEALFVAVIASTDVLGGGGIHTTENVEQRELAFDALIEGGGHEKVPLPRGVRNPIRVGDHILNLDGLSRVDWKLRQMLDDDTTEPRTSARLIGMGLDMNYRAIIFCVQDVNGMSEIKRDSFSRCINVAAEI